MMSNEAVATSSSRLAGTVAAIDRAFPLLWIGIYLLLPVSGWATEMLGSWYDQQRDLEALRMLLADGRADAIADSVIGPAYIGAAALIHEVLGLSPEDSLVALTRASYALSIAAGLVLVRVLLRRAIQAPPIVSIASQLLLVGLVFAAGTWYWSDVPWSHFFAGSLAVGLLAVRFGPSAPSVVWAACAGALLALLAATRSFELVAILLAWGIAALGMRAVRLPSPSLHVTRAVAGVGAFLVTTGAVYLGTGKREPFFLYSNHLDRQSGFLPASDVAETPTFSLGLVPVKLVQLFVDPCYLSLCEISDYPTGGGQGTNLELWSLPLAIQLPALLLLPFCLLGVGIVLARLARAPLGVRDARVSAVRPLVEMTIAATGLVVGYAGSTLTGPAHLRYGFARDFALPALLTAIVAVVLGSWAAWRVLERPRRGQRMSREIVFVVASFAVVVVVVAATTIARSSGLPRIDEKHLEAVRYTARCSVRVCDVRVDVTTTRGERISVPETSTLTFRCGQGRDRVSVYVRRLEGVEVPSNCAEPRLVGAWPTVMGLPPGVYEFTHVDVRNI